MEIKNNAEALKAFLGVSSPGSTQAQQLRNIDKHIVRAGFGGDQATVSHAGSEVLQSVALEGVRVDKVAAIQQALAAGTYRVPAAAVAGKVMESMLAGGFESGR